MIGVIDREYAFSVDLKSKQQVKNISISDESPDRVLFEGNLGKQLKLSLVEGDVLEFSGVNGILRISVTEDQLRRALKEASQVLPRLRDVS